MKQLLTIKELAAHWKVAVSFIYERTRKGSVDPIPHVKLGKYLRFEPEAVEKWLNEHNCR